MDSERICCVPCKATVCKSICFSTVIANFSPVVDHSDRIVYTGTFNLAPIQSLSSLSITLLNQIGM